MSARKREIRIVKVLLVSCAITCFVISLTAIVLFSDHWPRLNQPLPHNEPTVRTILSTYAGSLIVFALFCPHCFAKLHYGRRWKLWEPQLARWFTVIAFGFLSVSIIFPLGWAGMYYSRQLHDEDFQ